MCLKPGQEINFAAGEGKMALVKSQTDSAGRRAVVKVVNPNCTRVAPVAPLGREADRRTPAVTTMAASPRRHQGGGHKQHYRLVDFRRNKDGIVGEGRAYRV